MVVTSVSPLMRTTTSLIMVISSFVLSEGVYQGCPICPLSLRKIPHKDIVLLLTNKTGLWSIVYRHNYVKCKTIHPYKLLLRPNIHIHKRKITNNSGSK